MKKVLDKGVNACYNILSRVGGKYMPLVSLNMDEFVNLISKTTSFEDKWTNLLKLASKLHQQLKELNLPDVPVYIAGGCLRDLFVSSYPKDYDIFILPSGDEEQDDVVNLLLQDVELLAQPFVSSGEGPSSDNIVFRCTKRITHDALIYDLVYRQNEKTVEELLDSFDWAAVKIALDVRTGQFYMTQDAKDFFDPKVKTKLSVEPSARESKWLVSPYHFNELSSKYSVIVDIKPIKFYTDATLMKTAGKRWVWEEAGLGNWVA